ncbi:MAG: hypothetical protein IPM36_00130 [Lewinellaceae bacterium]|nr:hypothetical protein [Lewinellaceae bacterium]
MKTWKIVLVSLILPLTGLSQTWQPLDIPSAPRYDDVFFLNQQKGWTCNSNGQIYQTKDGGQNWTLQYDQFGIHLRSIEFLNDSIGFCGGLNAGAKLFRTTDGGQNWVNITNQIPGLPGGICGLSCPGNNVVYGCGQWSGPGYVIKSTDGGLTWEVIDQSALTSRLIDVFFITPDSGWVSGTAASVSEGGIILSTSDGGQPGMLASKPACLPITYGNCKRRTACIFLLPLSGISPVEIHKFLNHRMAAPAGRSVMYIPNLDSLYGLCGNAVMFETRDGGESWHDLQIAPGESFNRFHRLSSTSAILSGRRLYRLSQTSSSQPGPFATATEEPCRLQVFPNPGSGLVHIAVDLDYPTLCRLEVGRFDGRDIPQVLWTGEHPAGEYRFSTDLRPGGTGTYVVWLKTNFGTLHQIVSIVAD